MSIGNISMKTVSGKKKIAEKLHKQFGHASSNKISKLVKSAGIKDSELFNSINEVEVNCPVCLKYKKAPLKPVVGFSLSKRFNDVIEMNLKEINGHKILHIIDHPTCYSVVTIVKSKQKEEIVKAIFQHWVALFGPPDEILSDNGGEFNNELLKKCLII